MAQHDIDLLHAAYAKAWLARARAEVREIEAREKFEAAEKSLRAAEDRQQAAWHDLAAAWAARDAERIDAEEKGTA